MKKKVLITGTSGFVGQALCSALEHKNYSVYAAVRSEKRPHNIYMPIFVKRETLTVIPIGD